MYYRICLFSRPSHITLEDTHAVLLTDIKGTRILSNCFRMQLAI